MERLKVGGLKLVWLKGGVTHMDGGAMFGVVPKPLWEKKYPCNEKNQIELRSDPILIRHEGKNYLIESGMGNGKLTEKQKRNYGATEESELESELENVGLKPEQIDYVLMTHLHFDHACGLTKPNPDGSYSSVFPNAKIIASKVEWDEMRNPNIRSRNTYWEENWQAIEGQIEPFEDKWEHGPFTMVHTGGHSDGHSIILIEDSGELAVHMADLMPTHAHLNPLWVLAYDDYPMDSIFAKQKWINHGLEKGAWFTFYHDAFFRAVKWDGEGQIAECVKRVREQ
ncbi:YtnP family quorum-quenching lactonase [Bacillus sp. FJAT-27245]|uniref:YtnP family quorum-quenching lactonase n=1 Tax=Bacillus sp. FJAT-27245 TaxID=1684144 RepID=UPI0006A7AC83|nr:MBL fold metallo-hydrolase [Bacillus sp. FJAT-27245]